jgi:hypothetical protein
MAARTTRLTVASGPILEEFQSGQFRNDPGQQLGPWLSRAVPRRFSSRQKQPSELGEWDATGEIGTGRDAKCLPDNAEVTSSNLVSPTQNIPLRPIAGVNERRKSGSMARLSRLIGGLAHSPDGPISSCCVVRCHGRVMQCRVYDAHVVSRARPGTWGNRGSRAEKGRIHPLRKWATVLLATITGGLAVTGCGYADPTHSIGPLAAASVSVPSSVSPSLPVQNASLAATEGYRKFIVESAQTFVADTEALQVSIVSGNLAAARSSEIAAQMEYDDLRPQVKWGSQTALDLDGQADQSPPGVAFAGLHRVEQSLWNGTPLGAAVAALIARGPAIQFSVARTIVTPQSIIEGDVQELDWVDSAAVSGREEMYSHLDTIDVLAGVNAAETGFKLVEPLAYLVAGRQAYAAVAQFGSLTQALSVLGPAGAKPDSDIPAADWVVVGQHVDATATALAILASRLGSAGTGAGYGSYGRY